MSNETNIPGETLVPESKTLETKPIVTRWGIIAFILFLIICILFEPFFYCIIDKKYCSFKSIFGTLFASFIFLSLWVLLKIVKII